jgi:hypothetical protein
VELAEVWLRGLFRHRWVVVVHWSLSFEPLLLRAYR